MKSLRYISNDRSSNNGSVSMLKKRRKISIGNESFLDLSALHDSFLSSESQENDELSSSDYDSSNPYTTSSDSSLEQEKILKNTQKKKKQHLTSQKHINKKVLLVDIILQNYRLSDDMLKKFEFSSIEYSLFIILKILTNNLMDVKVLIKFFAQKVSEKENFGIMNQLLEFKIEEINEISPLILEKIKHTFILNCSFYLNKSLKEEALFPLFKKVMDNLKEFNYELFTLNIEIFLQILKEKKYEMLKFLIEKKSIRLLINDEKEVNLMLKPNNYNEINKSKTFKKMLINNIKIDLQLVILFYISESSDHYIVKRLLFEINLNKLQYKEILQIFIEYKMNSIAKEITKALLDTDSDIYQQINFSSNLNFSLISENLEYVWYCTSNPDFDLHYWLQNSETQSLLINSLIYSEGKNFEFTLYFLNKIEIWAEEKQAKSFANTIYKRLETPGLDNVLYTFYNPLKIVILLIEFLNNLSQKVVYNRSTLSMISNKIYHLAQLIISRVNDDKELNLILRDTDLEQRRVIYIIYENNLWEIISMQNVENVIDILWNGSILSEFDLLSIYSVSSNLFSSQKGLNYPKKENLFFARNNITEFQHHFTFQRVVWTYNCRIRLSLDNIITIALLLLTIYSLENIHKLRIDFFNQTTNEPTDIGKNDLFVKFQIDAKILFQNYMIFFMIFLVNFPTKLFCTMYYSKKLLIHHHISPEDIMDLVISILSLIAIIVFNNLSDFSLSSLDLCLKLIFSAFIVTIVIKIFFCFRIFRMFGPWMKALWVIFEACMKFLLIFIITIITFAFLGHISLFDNPNNRFISIIDALYYLVEVSGSQFTLDDYKDYKTVFGPLYLTSYIFVIAIIYMNLIISILSYNFEAASKVGRTHFNHALIGSLRKFEYDPIYGCLVIMPIYLYFLDLAFLGLSLIFDSEGLKKINKTLCRIGYFPISIIMVGFLISINLALIPCYYIYNFFIILFNLIKSRKSDLIPIFFQWIMIGFPLMIWQTLVDTYQATFYLWFAKKLVAEENKGISNLTYHILSKTLTEMYKKNMNICEFHQVIECLNQEEKNTPIRILEKSSIFKSFCSFNLKNKNSSSPFTNTPFPGSHEKYNAYDIIKNHSIGDPEQLLELLGKFSIVTKEIDELTNEKKKVVILTIRNILKLMKWYNKTSIRLTNYQLLYDVIRKIEN